MNIQTEILHKNPMIISHSISGELNESDAKTGALQAIELISSVIDSGSKFNLILNMKNYVFSNINSHRIWSLGFKEHKILKENVRRVAIVGKESVQLESEKELMETENLKFFIDLESANNWLLSFYK